MGCNGFEGWGGLNSIGTVTSASERAHASTLQSNRTIQYRTLYFRATMMLGV